MVDGLPEVRHGRYSNAYRLGQPHESEAWLVMLKPICHIACRLKSQLWSRCHSLFWTRLTRATTGAVKERGSMRSRAALTTGVVYFPCALRADGGCCVSISHRVGFCVNHDWGLLCLSRCGLPCCGWGLLLGVRCLIVVSSCGCRASNCITLPQICIQTKHARSWCSCCPLATAEGESCGETVILALAPIAKGAEITLSYIDEEADFKVSECVCACVCCMRVLRACVRVCVHMLHGYPTDIFPHGIDRTMVRIHCAACCIYYP